MTMSRGSALMLRDDVYFEPLIYHWYAWPYLVQPVTGAMSLAGKNLRLLRSFASNPDLHIQATRTPGFAGGSFVDCGMEHLDRVKALIADMECGDNGVQQVREAVVALNAMLTGQEGMSMEHLYAQVPAPLSGLVELVYDMQHRPGFRLIEGLLYESSLYKRSAQSISLGFASPETDRPFVLSSPRFPDERHLHAQIEFGDAWLDRLFRTRFTAVSESDALDIFSQVACTGLADPLALFEEREPKAVPPPPDNEISVAYMGHAGLLVRSAGVCVLFDPVIAASDARHVGRIFTFSDLPDHVDYVCLTHTHMDHTCIETLLQLRCRIGAVLVPKSNSGELQDPSLKLMLRALGFRVEEMEDMESLSIPGGKLRSLPFLGEHADLRIRSKTAWHLEIGRFTMFIGADAASLDEAMYRRIHEVTGDVTMFFVGMECVGAPMSWLYGSLFTSPVPAAINQSRRFNGSDFASARQLVDIFRPANVYVYALGIEPWFRYFMGIDYEQDARQTTESNKLIDYCHARGIEAKRLAGKQSWKVRNGMVVA